MRWENTVTIEAPADVVWKMTIDVESWPSITPTTVTRVVRLDRGPMRVGSRARIKQPGQTEAVWTVMRLEEGREFTWQTKRMGLTMVGSHLLEPVGDRSRNTLILDVQGRGAKIFKWIFGRLMLHAITTENASFRKRALQIV